MLKILNNRDVNKMNFSHLQDSCRSWSLRWLEINVRCHEVGGTALTVCVLGPRASFILVKGSANLLSFHTRRLEINVTTVHMTENYSHYEHNSVCCWANDNIKNLGTNFDEMVNVFIFSPEWLSKVWQNT